MLCISFNLSSFSTDDSTSWVTWSPMTTHVTMTTCVTVFPFPPTALQQCLRILSWHPPYCKHILWVWRLAAYLRIVTQYWRYRLILVYCRKGGGSFCIQKVGERMFHTQHFHWFNNFSSSLKKYLILIKKAQKIQGYVGQNGIAVPSLCCFAM